MHLSTLITAVTWIVVGGPRLAKCRSDVDWCTATAIKTIAQSVTDNDINLARSHDTWESYSCTPFPDTGTLKLHTTFTHDKWSLFPSSSVPASTSSALGQSRQWTVTNHWTTLNGSWHQDAIIMIIINRILQRSQTSPTLFANTT